MFFLLIASAAGPDLCQWLLKVSWEPRESRQLQKDQQHPANQPGKQRKAKHATNLFCSKMFLSCRARRNYENYRFVWHVLVSRAIFENYSNYMVSMWSCSVWIPQPTDLWEQQKICKSHANMQCFMRSCSELPPRAIFGNYSIFTYFYIVYQIYHCILYAFLYSIDSQRFLRTAALQNYNVSMCSCSALFLRMVFGKYNDITIFFEPPWYFLYVKRSPGCCTEWFLATTLHTNWLPRT